MSKATGDTEVKVCGSNPSPVKTLQIYRRLAFGRKHLFAPSATEPAEYFLINPIPHKKAQEWRPVFYRGDNPKYDSESHKIARARRTAIWSSFHIELGDGVHEVLENRRRMRERKMYQIGQGFRKFFCMSPSPPKKPLEDVQEVQGFVMVLKLRRAGFFTRTLRWELGGQKYKWSGTRRFLPDWSSRMKGISHDLKLVDSHGNIVATIEKDRWATFRKAIKTEETANKSRSVLGTLKIYSGSPLSATACDVSEVSASTKRSVSAKMDDMQDKLKGKVKLMKNVNLAGPHSGDLLEEAIVFTCWIALESEHRLRYKIFDVIREVGENVGG